MIIKTRKDRRIANYKQMIENRDEVIEKLQGQKDELKAENEILIEENKVGNKAIMLIEEIDKLIRCNKYSNEKVFLNKIKELVTDFQSNN